MKKLTEKDIENIVSILKKQDAGYLPLPILEQICRLITTTSVGVVSMRKNKMSNKLEVLLTKRSDSDIFFPNTLHSPIAIIRAKDKVEDTIQRILLGEVGTDNITMENLRFVKNTLIKTTRGNTMFLIYLYKMDIMGEEGNFFEVENLPVNLLSFQKEYILECAEEFEKVFKLEK